MYYTLMQLDVAYSKGAKSYVLPNVGALATWGARDGNTSNDVRRLIFKVYNARADG